MTLHVDYAAERIFAHIINGLRDARSEAKISQSTLSSSLPVRARAISEWETGAIEPKLGHLFQWSRELGLRLVIVGRDGALRVDALPRRSDEASEIFEQRRLASPLRNRRLALGMSQEELAQLVGVTRDSVQRWELVRVPPRPIALVVWAQKLGYTVALRPRDAPDRRLHRRAAVPAPRWPGSTVKHPLQQ